MKTLVASILALSLLGGGAALAQDLGGGAHVGPIGAGVHVGVGHHHRCRGWGWRHHRRYCHRWG